MPPRPFAGSPSATAGFGAFNDVLAASISLWSQQAQALRDVWVSWLSGDATADLEPAWRTLAQTWVDGATDFCNLVVHAGAAGTSAGGTPLVTFVIDRSAETDSQPQVVGVPAGVDVSKLVAMPPVSISDQGPVTLGAGTILLLPVGGSVEIRVKVPTPRPAPGHYLSVVLQPKAGAPKGGSTTVSPDPPVRPVVATVLIVFV